MSTTKRDKQAAETKDMIIRVALNLIQKDGYHNMSIRQLCKEAGISTGAFYYHFNSKEEMINKGFALYDENLNELLTDFKFSNPIEDIRFILLHQTKFVMENSGNLTKELYIAQLSSSDKYAVKHSRQYYKTIKDLVIKAKKENFIKSELSEGEITAFLLRVNRGVILDWCLNDYDYNLIEQAKKDLDFVLNKLTK